MDRSLARGLAHRFLDSLTPYAKVREWHMGPRKVLATRAFAQSLRSKQPGRILDRLAPLVAPVYGDLHVLDWTKRAANVRAFAVSGARASEVVHPDDVMRSLFDERAAFFNHLVLCGTSNSTKIFGGAKGGIGGHAVKRLLERGLATEDTLEFTVSDTLHSASHFHYGLVEAGLDCTRPWSFMFPVPGGAAVTVTHRVRPCAGMGSDKPELVASVRTVLRDDMLSPGQRQSVDAFTAAMSGRTMAMGAFSDWIRAHARPWEPKADAVDEERAGDAFAA